MKKSLNRTELTGLALLVILIIGITAAAVLLKDCKGEPQGVDDVKVVVVDTVMNETKTTGPQHKKKTQSTRKKSSAGKKEKSRKKKSSSAREKSEKVVVQRADPFSDTIPLY